MRTSINSPSWQVMAMFSGRRLALAATKARVEFGGIEMQRLVRRFERIGNGDRGAQRFHGGEIGDGIEAGADAVLAIFVTRQTFVGIDAVGEPHRVARHRAPAPQSSGFAP